MLDIEEWGKSGVKGLPYIPFGGKTVFVGHKAIFSQRGIQMESNS